MGEIVNLRRARKAKSRIEAEAAADQNRIAFGRAKLERELGEKEKSLKARRLDGHQLTNPAPDADD